jgi:hypothetical protein
MYSSKYCLNYFVNILTQFFCKCVYGLCSGKWPLVAGSSINLLTFVFRRVRKIEKATVSFAMSVSIRLHVTAAGTVHEELCTLALICRQVLRTRNFFETKIVEKIKSTIP